MAQTGGKRRTWMIAVGLSVLAVIIATVIGVGAFSGGQFAAADSTIADSTNGPAGDAAADGSGASDGEGGSASGSEEAAADDGSADGSQVADAATAGLPEREGGEPAMDQEVGQYVPNEVLVMVEDPAVLDELQPGTKIGDAVVQSVKVLSDDPGEGAVAKITLEGDGSTDSTEATVEALNAMEGVSAQKNFIYHLM